MQTGHDGPASEMTFSGIHIYELLSPFLVSSFPLLDFFLCGTGEQVLHTLSGLSFQGCDWLMHHQTAVRDKSANLFK